MIRVRPPVPQDPNVAGFCVVVGGAVMCRKDRAEGGRICGVSDGAGGSHPYSD